MEATNKRRPQAREYRMSSATRLKRGLVLKRSVGEQIYIGSDVVITLVSTDGPVGQIHVHAPQNIVVDRAEVRLRKMVEARGG